MTEPPPAFDELKVSTITIMVWSNLTFDLREVFETLPITEGTIIKGPKKRMDVPYGAIVSLRNGTEVRGIDLQKKKKRKKVDRRRFNFFLNQVTVVVNLGHTLLNIMMFKDNFKVVGCKSIEDAIEAIKVLWEEYFMLNPRLWNIDKKLWFADTLPHFLFEEVMTNYCFNLGFRIDREALNMLMNSPEYSDVVIQSLYEPSINTNVNVQMYYTPSTTFREMVTYTPFEAIRESVDGTHPYVKYITEIKRKKKKNLKTVKITFIVFSSSKITLSGRDIDLMRQRYNYFVKILTEHKGEIEEQTEFNKKPFAFA